MRWRRVAFTLAVAAATAAGSAALYVRGRADAAWGRMAAWAEAEQSKLAARPCERPPLWGEPAPGSAWEAYARARNCGDPRYQEDGAAITRWRTRPEEVPAGERARLARDWQPALAAMREGARRPDARHPTVWESGVSHHTANLLSARAIVNLAVLEARDLLDEGRGREAVELLLDAATFGADHAGSPILIDQAIGCALVAIATGEAWTDARLRRLDAGSLGLLAAGLARLDALLPTAARCEAEAVLFARSAQRTLHLWEQDPRLSGLWWRHGFSSRWSVAEAVLSEVAAIERLRGAECASWAERRCLLERELESATSQDHPLLQMALPNFTAIERQQRTTAAVVRLLRCAVGLHQGGAAPRLPDPLGAGPLVVERHDDHVVLTCAEPGRVELLRRVVALD